MNRQRTAMGKPPTRSHRILALVPPEHGRSDASGESSGEEGEESHLFRNCVFSDTSSENPSIGSSLERLDLLSEDNFGPTLDPDQNFFAQESNSEDETAPSHIRHPCFIPESDTEYEHSSPHILQNTISPKTNTNYAGDEIQVILPEESSPIAVMPSCSSWNGDLPSIPSNISSLPSEPFPTPSTSAVSKKKSPAKRLSKRKITKQQQPAPTKKNSILPYI
ncbi:unnamed protein product [Parnassius apollo]|uniref:(apollo) hypothetical protein n=1 Tax=Parnassius apollo TaxID=110799 RepID=A0A8S3Y0U9_PARAO|nr:unnamed protein product [Parnassius apollo]